MSNLNLSLVEASNNKIKIYIDDEFFGLFNKKTVIDLNLSSKTNLSLDQFNSLQKILENKFCKPKAIQILSRRDHSKLEMIKKLEKIANSKTVEKIIDILQNRGFIDDFKYANNLAKKLLFKKCYGTKRIVYELKLKGIDSQIAMQVVGKIKKESVNSLVTFIKKKYINRLETFKYKQKIIRTMLQKGHCYDDIKKAISIVNSSDDR